MTSDARSTGESRTPKARRFKHLRFRQLRAFLELAETGTFAAAAKRLDLAVTSVWQQVRSLEAALGSELVHAEGRTLTLTVDGQRLLGLVTPLVRGFENLPRSFGEAEPGLRSSLTLAAPAASIVHDLPGLVTRFRAEHADVELRLVERDSAACIRLVEKGAADVAVAGVLDESAPAALAMHRVARHPFTLVCRTDHAIARTPRLSLAALARHPFVLADGGNARVRFDAVMAKAGVRQELRVAMEAAADESLFAYVRKGFGVTVLPLSPAAAVDEAGEGGSGLVFRDASRLFGHETLVLVHRRFRCQPVHEKALCDLLMRVMGSPPARGRAR